MNRKEPKPTRYMLNLLEEISSGGILTRRSYASGYRMFNKGSQRTIAYRMPATMEDMGLLVFTRDNEESKYSLETGALTEMGKALLPVELAVTPVIMEALQAFNASCALANVMALPSMDFMDLSDRIQAVTGIDIGVEIMREADKGRDAVVPRSALLCEGGLDMSACHGPATY